MQPRDAARLARSLMNDFGLHGWVFTLDRAKLRFGQCRHSEQIISMSDHLIRLNDEDKVRDTILHEIAHAMVGPGHGHDHVWKRQAEYVGAKPTRCYDRNVNQPKHRWNGVCGCVGKVFRRHRLKRSSRYGSCPRCKVRITWKEVA